LTGQDEADAMVLVGVAGTFPATTTQWRLSGSGAKLRGRAIQTRWAPKAFKGHGLLGETDRSAMCAVIWTVEASRQGK